MFGSHGLFVNARLLGKNFGKNLLELCHLLCHPETSKCLHLYLCNLFICNGWSFYRGSDTSNASHDLMHVYIGLGFMKVGASNFRA